MNFFYRSVRVHTQQDRLPMLTSSEPLKAFTITCDFTLKLKLEKQAAGRSVKPYFLLMSKFFKNFIDISL